VNIKLNKILMEGDAYIASRVVKGYARNGQSHAASNTETMNWVVLDVEVSNKTIA
jgi:hypothetical protein